MLEHICQITVDRRQCNLEGWIPAFAGSEHTFQPLMALMKWHIPTHKMLKLQPKVLEVNLYLILIKITWGLLPCWKAQSKIFYQVTHPTHCLRQPFWSFKNISLAEKGINLQERTSFLLKCLFTYLKILFFILLFS